MMKEDRSERFVIEGGRRLSGTIDVRGSKNAATPIIAATVLTQHPCVLTNIPRIEDVFVMLDILESMGSRIEWLDDRTVEIVNADIDPERIDAAKVKKMRSSILLLGSLSARFETFSLAHPGGCVIGARPTGTHFDALRGLGVVVEAKDGMYRVEASKRVPANVVLREFSVTATENAMMLAAAMEGETTIKIAAAEPHVEDLGRFLQSIGAEIDGLGTHTITISGKKREALTGAKHTIIPDANEAATFLILGAATGSDIVVRGAREDHLDLVLERLKQFGAGIEIAEDGIRVFPAGPLAAFGKLDARIYPGVPTDIQAPLGVLATQARGETLIHDTLFEGRFNYIGELQKMGANAHILNPHQALIVGKTPLRGTTIFSYDLRAGVALIIAAILAEGTTIIEGAYQVDRGYEHIEERLAKLGASIRRL